MVQFIHIITGRKICMKKIFRPIISLLLTAAITAAALPAAAAEPYTVRDAYMQLAAESPDFILNVLQSGGGEVFETDILRFMISLQRNFYKQNKIETVTEDNFEENFIYWVKTVSNASEFAQLQNAISRAYPDATNALRNGKIHESIMPLFREMTDMVLGRNMLDRQEEFENMDFHISKVQESPELTVVQLEDANLPSTLKVLSESGLWVSLPVSWDGAPTPPARGTL